MQVALRLGVRLRVHGRQVQQRRGQESLDPLQLLPPLPPPQVQVPWNERRQERERKDMKRSGSLWGTDAAATAGIGGGGVLDVPPQSKRSAGGRPPLPASAFATGNATLLNAHLTKTGSVKDKLLQLSLFSLREQDVAAVRESFRQRGDVVELADLGDLLRAHLGGQVAPASLLAIFGEVDVNSAGAVSWKEFADAVLDSSLSTLRAASGISGEADNAEGIEGSLFEKRVTTSWVPSSGDSWGAAGEAQPGIGSRSNVLVGAVFVPQRDLVVCATLEGNLEIFRATTGMRVTNSKEGAIRLPPVPLVPHQPPPRIQSPNRATFSRRASSVASSFSASRPASAASSESVLSEPSRVETQVTGRLGQRPFPRSPLATDSLAGVAHNGESSSSSTATFNVPSHVICLAALEESSCVAVAMTDGSLRIFDVAFQEQICEYKVHERGGALVTALSSCLIIDSKGDANAGFQQGSTRGACAGAGGARKLEDGFGARMLAVGNSNGMLSLVNVDVLLEEVAKGSARASPACLVLSKNIFTSTDSPLPGQNSTVSLSKALEPAVNEAQARVLKSILYSDAVL